ncbi:uncharacterized protein [Venturia canescens]|nr:uncharacterized protein LOC122406014 isoform X2 [Venturia canescens]XP_043267097.1 uncharacterized protein LOC122406014 isoform X2 [Venturia canescens]XP_043267098.1 uncharacterized protein LOC122406014 isoform X2 [Venturia canescens]XP_043267099.1 uncharacterized protein LOC122406014 isoform X2 [Venturia canescens]XP_043267100.1 uncharacterized protein LOC122406014 isoform X2 [Venturia canescens]XP_043267101.1 uncharacterized protein LOC122406014 isoform X2 [Venturia canescens]
MRSLILGSVLLLGAFFVIGVESHGRLIEPPSRASMWRYGFDTPHDYNDHESYCGGFSRQWNRNGGKCGICGDPWDMKKPRAHENGGLYGNNVIVRKYRTGSVIPVRIELTANHHGYFEFRTCAMTARGVDVTDECLDKYLLKMENGTARYYPGPGNRIFEGYYKLPDELTCAQCVFQWRYIAGNNWGECGNGTGAVGCGPQEEFRGCADITIGDNVPPLPPRPKVKPGVKMPTETPDYPTDTFYVPQISRNYWLYSFIIAGTCLVVVLAAMALIYAYYYHANRAKQWLKSRRLLSPESPPIAPPRHKRHSLSNIQLQI